MPERVANPKIREDRAAQDFQHTSEKFTRVQRRNDDVIRAEAMTCHSQELILQDKFVFFLDQMMTEMDMPQSLMSNLAKRQKEQPLSRVSDRLSRLSTFWSLLRSLWKAATSKLLRSSFEPAARCINDSKRKQLVTRSDLLRLKLCMSFPPQAGNEFIYCCLRIFQNSASTSVSL